MTVRLSEAEIVSAAFDRPASGAPSPRRVLLCSAPRTASWSMCRIMIAAGFGTPAEYFNPQHLPVLARRWDVGVSPRYHLERLRVRLQAFRGPEFANAALAVQRTVDQAAYLRALFARRTADNGVFSAKIHWSDFEPMLRLNAGAARELFDGAFAVLVTRADKVGQAASLAAAARTGRYGFDGSHRLSPKSKPPTSCLRDLLYQDFMWRAFFAANAIPFAEVRQEALAADAEHALLEAAAELGVALPAAQLETAIASEQGGRYAVNARSREAARREIEDLLDLGAEGRT
jgi:LPS sulfotransferase NodH